MPDVILPALNEEAAIEWVLDRMPSGYRAIVVDNGSTDRTAELATAAGALVVHAAQRGFGAACFAGLNAATDDIICFMDCDASLDPQALPTVVEPVVAGDVDLMIGARRAGRGAWPLHARWANKALAFEIRRRTGLQLDDIGPMRAMRRDALLALDMQDRRSA
jgi:glycosyltransferase involved in cell wall biosynthesis